MKKINMTISSSTEDSRYRYDVSKKKKKKKKHVDLINCDEVLSNARKSPGSLGRPFWLIYSTLPPCVSPLEKRAKDLLTRLNPRKLGQRKHARAYHSLGSHTKPLVGWLDARGAPLDASQ